MQNKDEKASLSLAEEQAPSRLAKELSAGSAGMRLAIPTLSLQASVPTHDTTRVYLFLTVLNAENHDCVIYQLESRTRLVPGLCKAGKGETG